MPGARADQTARHVRPTTHVRDEDGGVVVTAASDSPKRAGAGDAPHSATVALLPIPAPREQRRDAMTTRADLGARGGLMVMR